mgnify:FL=1
MIDVLFSQRNCWSWEGDTIRPMFKKVSQFFVNVANEMKKVRWPTKKELVKYTITVIVTVTFVTLFFVVVDFGISSLLKWITG